MLDILNKHLEFEHQYDERLGQYITIITPVCTLSNGKMCKDAHMYIYNYCENDECGWADQAYYFYKGVQHSKGDVPANFLWRYFEFLLNNEEAVELDTNGIQYIFFKYYGSVETGFNEYFCIKRIFQGRDLDIVYLPADDWWAIMLTNNTHFLEVGWDSFDLLPEEDAKELLVEV